MISKALRIDELRKIVVQSLRKLDKGHLRECLVRLKGHKPIFKDIKRCERAKAEGNRIYSQKDLTFAQLYKILALFNESIAFAPKDSEELATAYANKSAALLRMRKYKECILEINNALKITESMALKVKMLCRKAECLTALGSTDNRICLEKAKFIISKYEDAEIETTPLNKLIKRTQLVIDNDKLDIPKEDKRKTQALKLIEAAEKRNISESIGVESSKIYRKHLVAARDFEPGEIILVEKPYLNCLDESKAYEYCSYCFHHLWTVVPCDHCSQWLYCSEKCKMKAWNEHHEMDCFLLACMRIPTVIKLVNGFVPLVLSVFCKALKEAGSIEQLVADSDTSNQHERSERAGDQTRSDVSSNSNLMSYKSIFTLPFLLEHTRLTCSIEYCIFALVGLAMFTRILGKTYRFVEMKELVKNDTAVLIGALLLKFGIILASGCPNVSFIDPYERKELEKGDSAKCHEEPCDGNPNENIFFSLPVLMSHTVNGCIPNVERYVTHGNKFILCALQRIKSGDQLMVLSESETVWEGTTKSKRQVAHRNRYSCSCECRACTENWSDTYADGYQLAEIFISETHNSSTAGLWHERNSIILDWEANCHKPIYPDIKMLSRTMDLTALAFKRLSMPSSLILKSVSLLDNILEAFYDPSEIYARAPHLRRKIGYVLDQSSVYPRERESEIPTEYTE